MLPTVGFPVTQVNPIQKPLMAVGIVPKAEFAHVGFAFQERSPKQAVQRSRADYVFILFCSALTSSCSAWRVQSSEMASNIADVRGYVKVASDQPL